MPIGSDRALTGAFGSIDSVPTVIDSTASTVPARLTAVLAGDLNYKRVRRLLFQNLDGTNTISLLFALATGAANFGAGLTVANGLRVQPGATREIAFGGNIDIGIVASAGTPAFNAVISDS